MPGITVTATNLVYNFAALPRDRNAVRVELSGFQPVLAEVEVRVAEIIRADFS